MEHSHGWFGTRALCRSMWQVATLCLAVLAMSAHLPAQSTPGIAVTGVVANDAAAGDQFGNAIAIQGSTAVVGAHADDDRGTDSGSVYVLDWNGSAWAQVAKLTASDGAAGAHFGCAVAMCGDTIVVGAEGAAGAGAFSGAAYVFERSGASWVQTAKLLPAAPQANLHFGFAVALDGDIASIGAWGQDSVAGAAYVFERTDGAWTQTAVLTAADPAAGDYFGHCVSLSGTTLLVGSPADDDRGVDSGSAYVFERRAGVWTQTAKLVAADGAAADYLGRVGSIDGDTLVLGARDDDDRGASSGAAYVFRRDVDGAWRQVAKLVPGDGRAGDVFGHSVALGGGRIVVGAKWRDDTAPTSGAAYLFEQAAGTWTQSARLNAPDPRSGDAFGQAVGIDGRRIAVGAWHRSSQRGGAYVFELPSAVDAGASTLHAADPAISSFGGTTAITVTVLAADGSALAGLAVRLETSAGTLLGSPVDHGDGTYTQMLAVDDGAGGAAQAMVTAVADGVRLAAVANVTLVPVSLELSTVVADPGQVVAGSRALVTVTPRAGDGAPVGPGLAVTIGSTLGTLSGDVMDNGDGTYTQWLDTDVAGTATISATVAGLSLRDTAVVEVAAAQLGAVVGVDASGTEIVYSTIRAAVNHARRDRLRRIFVAPGEFHEVVVIRRARGLRIEANPALGPTTVRGLRIIGCHDVAVSGFTIDARGTHRNAVAVHHSTCVEVSTCLVLGTDRNRTGVDVARSRSVRLRDLLVEGWGRAGIRVRRGCRAVYLVRCTVAPGRGRGIVIERGAQVTVSD